MGDEARTTPFGPIPREWQLTQVGKAGQVQIGRARSPGTDNGPNMVPYLRVANVLDGYIDYSDVYAMHFSEADQKKYTVRKGDILLNEGQSTELVGRSAIFEGPEHRYCYQNSLVNFRCGPSIISQFARAVFKRWLDIGHFTTIAKQTTSMAHLGGARFAKLEFPVPPLAEQRRIAEMLDTLDEAIRKTEQLIAKLKQAKQGLLHDLLTRGIDANGELRDPERNPEQFKNSLLGRIPIDWHLTLLHEVAEIRSGIAKNEGRILQDPVDVHYLRVANVQDGFLDLREMKTIRIPRSDLDRYRVLPGDVLMNEGGDLDKLGRGSLWHGEYEPCVHQNHVFVVRCGPMLLPEFLSAWTGASRAKAYFMVAGKQTTNLASINKTQLGRLPVLLPSRAEQERILNVLSSCEEWIALEGVELAKLRVLKQGLMEDLLTGRVRVTNLLSEVAA
ncbi:MAG TPA: restriction endonuclease subunit S [Kofleriaceae bacterium]|jgi:type I restriction enzyme S subunit|nr:restriction endonuclease subunit S [Kofleriaceae bacterium]